jgi:hypothetical protein
MTLKRNRPWSSFRQQVKVITWSDGNAWRRTPPVSLCDAFPIRVFSHGSRRCSLKRSRSPTANPPL